MILNLLLGNAVSLGIIGLINARKKTIKTIFLLYPADEKYTAAYVYKWYARSMRWTPRLVGLFRQNGFVGIIFGVSATEKDFLQNDNIESLKLLESRLDRIRHLLKAEQKTFAGILPGALKARGILDNTPETDIAVEAIVRAEEKLRSHTGYRADVPLIILGGKGYVGRRIMKKFDGRDKYCVDLVDNHVDMSSWPRHLTGEQAILINVTKKAALAHYLDLFWPELVLLNETYPEPTEEELKVLKAKGCQAYHISGVKAQALPSFPRAYNGGIPCCAACFSPDMEVLLKDMHQ